MPIIGKRRLWATYRYFNVRRRANKTVSGASQSWCGTLVNDVDSARISTTPVSIPLDITSEDAAHTSVENISELRDMNFSQSSNYLLEVENTVHKSSCAELYFQVGLQDSRSNIILELLLQIISEPCFNILRTKEQLGYIVFSGMRRSSGIQGLRVIVQSERHPAVVDDRIEAFFHNMKDYITAMPDGEFSRHKSALAAHRLERPKRLGARASQLWSEISVQQYNFDRARVEVAELDTVGKDDILNLYEQSISSASPTRQKLSVHVISTAEGGAGSATAAKEEPSNADDDTILPVPTNLTKPQNIEDVTTFKSRHNLFPLATPFINIPRKGAHCKL